MIVIIFGVSGAGKTVVGQRLARELDWRFYDADDFHPPGNIEKMRNAIPLEDDDRQSWLKNLRELLERCLSAGEEAVLACSALKEKYRRYLRVSPDVKLVYLRGEYALIARRLEQRRGHFMSPVLLRSQFTDLEEPRPAENAIVIELGPSPSELVQELRRKLQKG